MPSDIHFKDAEKLQQKIDAFRKDGSASFRVVADFYRTLTKAFVEGKKLLSSYALIREGKYLTADYPAKAGKWK